MLQTKENKKGFTLVELIVVVTILAILATIGFVSYSSYLTGVRDTNRISQLRSISDGLNLYATTNSLPLPEDSVEIKSSVGGTDYLVAYQGYVGANILETIDFDKGGVDPKDNSYFTYMLTRDRKSFQLMAFLEESANLTTGVISESYAVNLQDRSPITSGDNLGVLTDASNSPIQEVLSSEGELILDGTGDEYTAHLNNGDETIVSNETSLLYGAYVALAGRGNRSCKQILSIHPYIEGTDGAFWIKTISQNEKVLCEMTTDGGGWTLALQGNDTDMERYDTRGNDSWNSSTSSIPYTADDGTFKFPDATLNDIRDGGSYMLVGDNQDGDPQAKVFVPSTCDYDHEVGNATGCTILYGDPAYTSTVCTGGDANQRGIGCFPSSGTRFITNSVANGGVNAVCYQTNFGGCTGFTSNGISVKMYVR